MVTFVLFFFSNETKVKNIYNDKSNNETLIFQRHKNNFNIIETNKANYTNWYTGNIAYMRPKIIIMSTTLIYDYCTVLWINFFFLFYSHLDHLDGKRKRNFLTVFILFRIIFLFPFAAEQFIFSSVTEAAINRNNCPRA